MRELERDPPEAAGASAGVVPLPRLVVVGRGRMGGALGRAATASGLDFASAGRDDAVSVCRDAEAALLCVPDAAIGQACERVATAVPPLRFVGHTSGVAGLDALGAAAERGAATFSLHPLQTVPDPEADLDGAPCAVAGSDLPARELAAGLAKALGMRPFEVAEARRAAYHAAASMASNFLVALEESAAGVLDAAGVKGGRELLAPIVLRSAENWAARGPNALTGPIARGDVHTVEAHLTALRETMPELVPLYEALAERTRELAASR